MGKVFSYDNSSWIWRQVAQSISSEWALIHNKFLKSPDKDVYITIPAFPDLFIFVLSQQIYTTGWPFRVKMTSLVF